MAMAAISGASRTPPGCMEAVTYFFDLIEIPFPMGAGARCRPAQTRWKVDLEGAAIRDAVQHRHVIWQSSRPGTEAL